MRRRWLYWLAPPLLVGAALAWWSLRALGSERAAQHGVSQADAAQASADPRLRAVLELVKNRRDPQAQTELVALYGRLASDPAGLPARTLLLNALFNEPALGLRLKLVLDAIAADSTPAPHDPLWPELVNRLSQQWSNDVLAQARDLMLMEQRARPQRALIASFAELVGSEQLADLPPEQAQGLLSDLIDLYAKAEPDQRPQIQEAVRKLGGNDPADLLAGQGLKGGKKLELEAEYEKNLQAGIDSLMKGQPDGAD